MKLVSQAIATSEDFRRNRDGHLAALDTIRAFPTSGGVSPDGRYNKYVARILGKTIQDLGGGKQSSEKKKKRKKK